jgi:hypothetical protein
LAVDSERRLTRRVFLRRAAKIGAVTWTVPALSSISLSHAQAGSSPPNGNGNNNSNGTTNGNTNVLGSSGSKEPPTSVLGSRFEAGSQALGSSGTLPATGPPIDVQAAAATAAGLITTGAALSKIGTRRLRKDSPEIQ